MKINIFKVKEKTKKDVNNSKKLRLLLMRSHGISSKDHIIILEGNISIKNIIL